MCVCVCECVRMGSGRINFLHATEWNQRNCVGIFKWDLNERVCVRACRGMWEPERLKSADNGLMKLYCLLRCFCDQTKIRKVHCSSFPSLFPPAAIHLYFHPATRWSNQWQPSKSRSARNTHNLPPETAVSYTHTHTSRLWSQLKYILRRVLCWWKVG